MDRTSLLIATMAALMACTTVPTLTMKLMSRDDGTIYTGTVNGNGRGSGTMSVTVGDKSCSGLFARGASNDSFGFFTTYGAKGAGSVGTVQSSGGTSTVKALMSCSDGKGIRCDFVGGGMTGTGICVDSTGHVFDAIVM